MEPTIFLEEGFMNSFKNFKPNLDDDQDESVENRKILYRTLRASTIQIDKDNKFFLSLFKKKDNGEFMANSEYEQIVWQAFRNNKLVQGKFDLQQVNTLFYLDKPDEEIREISIEKNVFCLGRQYNFNTRPVHCDKPGGNSIDDSMNGFGMDSLSHRCRCVVLVDDYIFNDEPHLKAKIPNLCKLISKLYLNNSYITCYLSIITVHPRSDKLILDKLDEIKNIMNNTNLKITVFANSRSIFKANRYLMTDYSDSFYNHIFDRPGEISTTFLYDGYDISRNFAIANDELEKIKKAYNCIETKSNMKNKAKDTVLVQTKFNNLLENPLFN
jgi:hypothetical protein